MGRFPRFKCLLDALVQNEGLPMLIRAAIGSELIKTLLRMFVHDMANGHKQLLSSYLPPQLTV